MNARKKYLTAILRSFIYILPEFHDVPVGYGT